MSPNARWQIGDDETYHIVTRANNRMKIFHKDQDFRAYLELLKKYKREHPLLLHHYCLMPNHVHLLIRTVRGADLQRFMQGVNQSYTRYYRRTHQHTGHLWQGRYKSFLIDKDSYLLECGRYIERNPVRANLAAKPEEWPWSSYHFYGWGKEEPLVEPGDLYLDLAETPELRQIRYREYVLQERPYESIVDKEFQTL